MICRRMLDKPLSCRSSGNLYYFAIILIPERGDEMVQTTIRLPEKLYEKLKLEAKKKGMSLNAYLLSVLWRT